MTIRRILRPLTRRTSTIVLSGGLLKSIGADGSGPGHAPALPMRRTVVIRPLSLLAGLALLAVGCGSVAPATTTTPNETASAIGDDPAAVEIGPLLDPGSRDLLAAIDPAESILASLTIRAPEPVAAAAEESRADRPGRRERHPRRRGPPGARCSSSSPTSIPSRWASARTASVDRWLPAERPVVQVPVPGASATSPSRWLRTCRGWTCRRSGACRCCARSRRRSRRSTDDPMPAWMSAATAIRRRWERSARSTPRRSRRARARARTIDPRRATPPPAGAASSWTGPSSCGPSHGRSSGRPNGRPATIRLRRRRWVPTTRCCGARWDPLKPGRIGLYYSRPCAEGAASPDREVAATGDCFEGLTIMVDVRDGTVVSIDRAFGPGGA